MDSSRTWLGCGLLTLALGNVAACADGTASWNDDGNQVSCLPNCHDAGDDDQDSGDDNGHSDGAEGGDGDDDGADGSTGAGDGDAGGGDSGDGDGGSTLPIDYDPRDPVEDLAVKDPNDLGLPTFPANAPGDLVISRTGRGCLSVDPAAQLQAGSEVTIGTCRGLPGQRWTVANSGVSLADASTLCLDAANGKFKLSRCADITPFKMASADGVIERGSTAADVTGDGELISYGTHRQNNQQWTLLSEDLAFLEQNKSHTVSYPLPAGDTLGYDIEEARHRVGMVQPPYPLKAARDVSKFPGSVAADAPMISRRVYLDTRFDHDTDYLRVSWPPKHWQSTGVYAPAGKVLVFDVPSDAGVGLFVRINGHTDELKPDSGNVKNGSFQRMPRVSMRLELTPGKIAVRSPYGGEVILESDVDTGRVVPVDIHGGVEMPRFVLGVTSDDEWARRRALDVPWAELEGDRGVITVPSSQIASLAKPGDVMEKYDRVVELEMDLFGLDPSAKSGVHRPYDGKARWMSDVQITAGYGHSGYPIMTTNGWKLADPQGGADQWGVWHELGHNHQQFCLWSSRFGTEDTNNLYSLYVQENFGHTSRIADNHAPMITKLEAGVVKWDDVDDPWNELVFLMQPVHAFPSIGWDLYRRVNRAYRELSSAERSSVCGSAALQVDTFYKILSKAANADLRDHFTRWGFNLSQSALDSVAGSGLKTPSVVVWRAKP
ncbi:MAG: M60 family metallopeptidase [Myxococcales bacterium]